MNMKREREREEKKKSNDQFITSLKSAFVISSISLFNFLEKEREKQKNNPFIIIIIISLIYIIDFFYQLL